MSKVSSIDTREAMKLLEGVKTGKLKTLMEHYGIDNSDAKKLNDRIHRMREQDGLDRESAQLINEGNTFSAITTLDKQKSISDMIKEFGLNEDDYIKKNIRVGKWGKLKTPMAQARVDLVPKKPELCDWPEIKAIRPEYKKPPKYKAPSKDRTKRALVIPDAQIGYARDFRRNTFTPFHDFHAFDLTLQVAQHIKPEKIILLGDMLDLPTFGKYEKKPEHQFTTQESLITLRTFIDDLMPHTSEIIYIFGNHEARFKRSLAEYNAEATLLKRVDYAHDLPSTYSIEHLLGLDDLGVKYFTNYPHDEFYLNDHLAFSHSHIAKSGSGATVAKIIKDDPHVSRFIGHIHRLERATQTTYKRGRAHTNSAFSCGTLSRLDDKIPQAGARQNWQQGLGTVWYEEDDGLFDVNLHHIEQGNTIVDGIKYESAFNSMDMSSRLGFYVEQ